MLLFANCKSPHNELASTAGVVITFDDQYVDEWCRVDSVLSVYEWKATFFVAKLNELSENEVLLLRKLEDEGHEIGGHGYHHVHAEEYIDSLGIDRYLDYEIKPMLKSFDSLGFTITSFAYPYGSNNRTSNKKLLEYFQIIRQLDWFANSISKQDCFYTGKNIVKAYPLDENYKGTDWNYIEALLNYAKENNKIIIFYSHCPLPSVVGDYQVEYDKLEKICSFVKENEMKFYTITQLLSIKK